LVRYDCWILSLSLSRYAVCLSRCAVCLSRIFVWDCLRLSFPYSLSFSSVVSVNHCPGFFLLPAVLIYFHLFHSSSNSLCVCLYSAEEKLQLLEALQTEKRTWTEERQAMIKNWQEETETLTMVHILFSFL